jgi:hypothetical protein
MADNTQTKGEETSRTKRAYVLGCVNTLKQAGHDDKEAVAMTKKAVAHREELYAPETQERLEKRANDLSEVLVGKGKELAEAK